MNILSKLSDTLKELLTIREITEQSLAEETGIPLSCISLYVRGLQAPYIDALVKLADYFNCSVDYLLGRTDKYTEKFFKACPPFKQRFNELLEENKCTTYKSFQKSDISKSSFYEWKRGKSLPTLENLIKLANFFDCSVDFVLGREN